MKIFVIIAILFMMGWAPMWWIARDELRRHIGVGFAANFLIPLGVASAIQSGPLFSIVLFVVTVATIRDRTDAVCRFVLLAGLLPNPSYYPSVGSAMLVPIDTTLVLAVATLIAAMIRPGQGARPIRGLGPEDGLVAVMLLVFWIGETRVPSITVFARGGLSAMLALLSYLTLRTGVRDAEDLRRIIACVAVTGVMLAPFALYETVGHWEVFRYVRGLIANNGFAGAYYIRGGLLRPSASANGPLMLTCYLSLCVLAAAISQRYLRVSWAGPACVAVILVACVLGQSRGSLVVLGCGILVLLALQRKWALAGGFVFAGAVAALALMFAARGGGGLFSGSESFVLNGQVYSDYREALLVRGVQEGMRNLWFGLSRDQVFERLQDLKQGEGIIDLVNIYLNVFLISGLAGFVPMVALMGWSLQRVYGKSRGLTESGVAVRAFLVAGMVALFIEFAYMSYIDRMPLMLFFLLAGGRAFVLGRGFTTDSESGVEAPPVRRALVETDRDPTGPMVAEDPVWVR